MLSRREDPFPLEACRDLIGLVRAIYRLAVKTKEPPLRLAKIAAIGLQLQEAYNLAATSRPGTMAHYAAWTRASEACRAIDDIVEPWSSAEPIVKAAIGVVRRSRR